MADRFTPEEIQEIFEQYNEAIRTGTPITAELAKSMKDASIGVKGASELLIKGFGQLGRSITDYGAAMYKGEQGFKAINKSLTDVEDAIDTFSNIILAAVAIFDPLVGVALFLTKTLVKGAIDYGKAAGEMSDKLYDSYTALSRVGAAGEQGMSGVYTSMQKFAYGIDELDQMLALIKENSKNLAAFSGTVIDGTNALADTANSIQRSGLQKQFLEMGMKVDDINRGTAGYYNQLGRLGQLQGKSQAELTAGTVAYLKEMEGLSRLTGQQREDMEKQRQEANMIDSFLAQVRQMGAAGEEAYKVFNYLSAQDPTGEAAKQFAASFSGFVTDASAQIFQSTGGQIVQLNQQLRDQKINAEQFTGALSGAVRGTLKFQEQTALIASSGRDMFGPLQTSVLLAEMGTKDMAKAMSQTKPIDNLTGAAVTARQAQMGTRDALQDMVRLGVKPATEALDLLAQSGKSAANALPGGNNKPPVGGSGGGIVDWFKRNFGSGTSAALTGADLSGTNADLVAALTKTADEYKKLTGNSVRVTSAVRTREQQQREYDAWIARGKTGNPVAEPGKSQHEVGNAVDITRSVVDDPRFQELLAKNGLARPVANDPVHVQLAGTAGSVRPGVNDVPVAGATSGYKSQVTAAPSKDNDLANSAERYNQATGNTYENNPQMQQMIELLAQNNSIAQDHKDIADKNYKSR